MSAGIDAFVTRMISARRRAPGETADLLSLLLAARDEHGGMLSDEEIRNESVTLLIAGYDTTANALAWAVSLVCAVVASWIRSRSGVAWACRA